MAIIREPAVSGTFYPGNAESLKTEIGAYLDSACFDPVPGEIIGIISPHAGYMYSGPVAAYGYKTLVGKRFATVVVISPSHRIYFDGASVMAKGAYKTPLGTIEIDEEMADTLLSKYKLLSADAKPHRNEHSLEVQLPFLQVVLGQFRLIPIVMGSQETGNCRNLAGALFETIRDCGKEVLIVGSTDLSHYHPYPEAVRLDSVAVNHLTAYDLDGIAKAMEQEKLEACGAGPMLTTGLLARMLGATACTVLKYMNSGDITGDKSGVVGYVSSVFHGEKPGGI